MYIFPKTRLLPGIKNDHIYHSAATSRGWIGILLGTFLIGFYVVLYFYPQYIVNWVLLVDPISEALNGGPASQWFLYGFLYTLCILIMGIRMIIKYRHSPYEQIRSVSVMFFQTSFAFIIPEILVRLNQPYFDFKNMWPLDYDFFFDFNLNELLSNGTLACSCSFGGSPCSCWRYRFSPTSTEALVLLVGMRLRRAGRNPGRSAPAIVR